MQYSMNKMKQITTVSNMQIKNYGCGNINEKSFKIQSVFSRYFSKGPSADNGLPYWHFTCKISDISVF